MNVTFQDGYSGDRVTLVLTSVKIANVLLFSSDLSFT